MRLITNFKFSTMKKILIISLLVLLSTSLFAGSYQDAAYASFTSSGGTVASYEEIYVGYYYCDHGVYLYVWADVYTGIITCEAKIYHDGWPHDSISLKVLSEETDSAWSWNIVRRNLVGYDGWSYRFTSLGQGEAGAEMGIYW